jgi:hypothetical protein
VPFDKAAGGQIENLLPVDGGVKREIETLERLAQIDGRAPEAQLQLFLGAALDFVFDEPLQEIDVGELFAMACCVRTSSVAKMPDSRRFLSFGTS